MPPAKLSVLQEAEAEATDDPDSHGLGDGVG